MKILRAILDSADAVAALRSLALVSTEAERLNLVYGVIEDNLRALSSGARLPLDSWARVAVAFAQRPNPPPGTSDT